MKARKATWAEQDIWREAYRAGHADGMDLARAAFTAALKEKLGIAIDVQAPEAPPLRDPPPLKDA